MSLVVDQYFLIKPNYKSQVSIKRKWQTGIQTSINKNEKRAALLTWPRRTLKYNIQASSFMESSYIKRKIYKNLHLIWGIPIWVDETLLSEDKAIGTTVFPVNSTEFKKNFEIGAEIVILSSTSVFEILTIDSFTDSSITTTSASTLNWSTNATIYPVLKGKFKNTHKVDNEATSFLETAIELEEEYDEITRSIPSIAGFDFFKGYPLLNIPPDWGTKIETTFLHDYEELKFLGASTSWTNQNETEFKFKNGFALNTLEDISKLIDFFDYHKGRWGVFWRPSWVDDLLLSSSFSASASVITIQDIDYSDFWEGFNAGKWLMLIWPDNTYVIRGVSRVSGNQITLHRQIGKECTEIDLPNMLICFVNICRFAQDEIEIQYSTNSFSDIDFTFQSVLTETPLITSTTTTSSTTSTSTSSSTISSTSSSTSSSTTNTQSTTSSTASSTSTTSSTASSTTTNTQSTTTSSTFSSTSTTSTSSSTISSTTTNTQSTTTSSTTSSSSTTSTTFAEGDDVYAFNPANKGAGIALSNNNRTATRSGASGWQNVKGMVGMSTGKWYWEIYCDALVVVSSVTNDSGIGLSSLAVTSRVGLLLTSITYAEWAPGYFCGNTMTGYGDGLDNGDTLMIAYDADAGKIWFGENGTWMGSGDPGAGTNPAKTGFSGEKYPIWDCYGAGNVVTIRTSAALCSYSAPSGFVHLNGI